jgi:fatty-acyl-CoA synthase
MDKEASLKDNTLIKLWDGCLRKLPEKDAIVFLKVGAQPFRWNYLELFAQAEKFAAELKNKGVKKGDVCAIVITYNAYFYPLYLSVMLLRAVPAVLAYPNPRLHQEKFINGIQGMTKKSGFDWILTEEQLESALHPFVYFKGSKVKGMLFPLENSGKIPLSGKDLEIIRNAYLEIEPGDDLLLQHSSGTTGLQKPVLLTNEAVCKQIRNYSEAIHLTQKDKVISWLPLYHDMGLIAAFHLPLACGVTSVQIDPFEWAAAPSIMLQAISAEKTTLAWMPNFAFSFMASKIREENINNFNLDSMRMFINCSEPVRNDSIEKFTIRYAQIGLNENVVSTSYAMAETAFAVTQTPPVMRPVKLRVDYLELKGNKIKVIDDIEGDTKTLISSGRIINGCKIRIVDEKGFDLDEGNIGEIVVSSESLFSGYRHYTEKTKAVLKNGWYYTGDNGFMYQDNLYVLGRKDDLIISAGNNIYPEDVEDCINDLVGIVPGRVVAFGEYDETFGSELVCVIAETNITDIKDKRHLKVQIIKVGMEINVNIRRVFLVPPRWLIKSSSGKPSRKENKIRIFEAAKEMEV